MRLTIVLSQEVTDEEQAATKYEAVKIWLADNPEVTITGQVTSNPEPVEPPT